MNKQIPSIGIDEHETNALVNFAVKDARQASACLLAADLLREHVAPGVMAYTKREALLIGVVRMLFKEGVLE